MFVKRFFIGLLTVLIFCTIDCAGYSFKPDSTFLKPFPRKFTVRSMVGIKEFSFSIKGNSVFGSKLNRIAYKPNNGLVGGVGVSYRNLLASYYFKIPGTEQDVNRYGETTISDLQINLTTRYVFLSAFHRLYNGFYVSNPEESYPGWERGMPNPLRRDISYTIKGAETMVGLNPRRYSLNASLKLTEQQLRSVFATFIYANYAIINVRADSSLIPSHLRDNFFDGKELYKCDFSGWSVQPGVTYSFVHKKWFFNPMIFAGLGRLQKDLYFANKTTESYKDFYFRVSGRFNCGYNSKLFFAGIFIDWNEMLLPEKNLMIKTENFNVMLVAGFRF